jgi:exodeoxyribonuclease VIII
MLDLETFGNGNDAVIASIGAVKFNETEILDEFHVGVDPASCQALGLKMDASTIIWWLHPDRTEAREQLLALERVDLASALVGFNDWIGEPLPIWGNGSTFDNVILRSAYRAAGIEYPAPFWLDRCYRTVKALAPGIQLVREGTHHDACDDARCQAKHLQAIAAHLGGGLL